MKGFQIDQMIFEGDLGNYKIELMIQMIFLRVFIAGVGVFQIEWEGTLNRGVQHNL